MGFPGTLTKAEIATGLLIRSIKVNGDYLLCNECSFNQTQEIDTLDSLVQGGPGRAIANIGAKKFTGSLKFPLRYLKDGTFDPAVKKLINHAQNPISVLKIDSNHILTHYDITDEDHSTDNNELLSIDAVVVKSLTVSCENSGTVSVSAEIEGMIDTRANSDYVVPNSEQGYLGRALTWGDCNAFRAESSMRTVSNLEFSIENSIETPVFLPSYISGMATTRTDQIGLIGVKSVKWSGKVEEFVRKGSDLNTYIHGGWMVSENLTLYFGTMKVLFTVPLFNITEMPASSSVFKRTVTWTGLTKPNTPLSAGQLITFE